MADSKTGMPILLFAMLQYENQALTVFHPELSFHVVFRILIGQFSFIQLKLSALDTGSHIRLRRIFRSAAAKNVQTENSQCLYLI